MSAQIITATELVEYGSRSMPMDGFANAQVGEAVARATDRIRQAALNDYTPDSFELLTTANAPDELRELALAVGLHVLTRGDGGRPASIDDGYIDATRRLGYVAAGKTYYDKSPNAVLVKLEDADGGAGSSVSSVAAERVFDRTDQDGQYNRHSRRIP